MSFSKVGPAGGWAVGATFTSAQANQLDTDHANALDKTTAGDTLSGAVNLAATGFIGVLTPGAQIASFVGQGITAVIAGGISSGTSSGFALTGGANDWPTFGVAGSVPRSRTVTQPLTPWAQLASGWTAGSINPYLDGPATSTGQPLTLPGLHNGATLSSVTILFAVANSHTGVPTNLPSLSVTRYPITTGVVISPATLSSSNPQSFTPTPGSGAAWYNSNQIQALTYTCNQNNVIDTSKFSYAAYLIDENGTNSISGNTYFAVQYSYTIIQTMAFP